MNNYFLLGIDYGPKKTGLAIGQSVTRNSRPLRVLYSNYVDEIKKIIYEWDIKKLLLGILNIRKKVRSIKR